MPTVAAPPAPASAPASTPADSPPGGGAPTTRTDGGAPPDSPNEPSPWMDEIGAEIESMDDGTPVPEPDKNKGKAPAAAPAAPADKKGQAAPTAAAAPPEDKTPSNIKDLRKGYEDQKKKIRDEFEPTIARLQKENKELRESPQVTQTKEQQERFKSLEARNKELEQEIRYVNYRKSEEFREKHLKPQVTAWEKARRDLEQLEVTMPNGQTRKATDADLVMLAQIDSPVARLRKANEMFVDFGEVIARHADRIADLADAQEQAEAAFLKEAETKTQTDADTAKTANETRVRLWNTANEELAKKYPDWFAPAEGDTPGNTLLDKGLALADLYFAPRTLDAKRFELLPKVFRDDLIANKGKLSEQGSVRLHALMRNKIGNHDRQILRANALLKKVKKLEKDLKDYEASAPGGRPAAPGGHATTDGYMEDANAEIEKMDNPQLG